MPKILLVGHEIDHVLFKVAIEAAQQGNRVWFISIKPIQNIPKAIEPPCKDILQLVTFMYLKNFKALMKHLNGLQKWRVLPNVLILKNIDQYCNMKDSEYDSRSVGFLVASLIDTLTFLKKKFDNSRPSLVVSCSSTIPERHIKVLNDLYFDSAFLDDHFEDEEEVRKISAAALC